MRALGPPKIAMCPNCGDIKTRHSIKGEAKCSKCGTYFCYDRELRYKYREEWKKNNPRKYKARNHRRNVKMAKLYEELRQKVGNRCDFCGCSDQRLEFHERNGIEHPLNPLYLRKHFDKFVLLCKPCHEATHWAMEKLGMDYINFKAHIGPILY